MAVSTTVDKTPQVPGAQRFSVSSVTFDSKYVTGGEPLTAAELGLTRVDWAIATVKKVGGTVNVAQAVYNVEKSTLQLFDETPAEVASEADVSNIVVQVVAFGV